MQTHTSKRTSTTEDSQVRRIIQLLSFVTLSLVLSTAYAAGNLKTLDGKPAELSDYTGKGMWTVVILWASDCHVCNAEAEQYIQFHEDNKDKNAQILGITLDGQAKIEAAKDFIKRHDVTYPSLIGEPEDVATLYSELTGGHWVGTPTFLIYDRTGKLKAAQPGAVPADIIEGFIRDNELAAKPK